MKVELHSNGSTQVHLTAITPIEEAYLSTMLELAGKGATVTLTRGGGTDSKTITAVVSVDAGNGK